MRNKIYLLALLLLLMHLPTLAQIGGDYNPSNPGDPGTPVLKYTLTLNASPAEGGYFSITSTKVSVGEYYNIRAYSNTDFVFVAWICDGDTISKSASYNITMPAHDVEITGVFRYNPTSPGDPQEQALKYQLTLRAEPVNSGTFNIYNERVSVGSTNTLNAYSNTDFVFKHWRIGDSILSTNPNYSYKMPAHNVTIIGQFEYNPSSPANPNANHWNPTVGEVIVDDFNAGYLSSAITSLLNRHGANKNDVRSIIVAGRMTSNDFGIANTYTNCAILDLRRVTGINQVPSYAFDYTNIESVSLPESIEIIGEKAFYQCTKLGFLTLYAMTPPQLGSNVFTGVPDGLVVYVPETSVSLYQNDPNWGKYIILPIHDDLLSLTVNFPNSANMTSYTNMQLELYNSTNGQRMHYILTDKMSYVFNGIKENSVCDVTLRNQYGDVFGNINGILVDERDERVTLASLIESRDVALTVIDSNGEDKTKLCDISWIDENGNILIHADTIMSLPIGRVLNYQIILPQELATTYALPALSSYMVHDGDNTIVCQLTTISQSQLKGRVIDATSNKPLNGASITAIQSFGDKYSKTQTSQSDDQGSYSLDVSSVPTTLTFVATGYLNQTLDCSALMNGASVIAVPDVSLVPITGAVVNIDITFAYAHLANQASSTQNGYDDYNNVDFEVFNKTKNRALSDIHVQYQQIVLTDDVDDGDVLEITATSRTDSFYPVKTTVVIFEQKATATINIVERGRIVAKFKKNTNSSVTGTLYDADNKLISVNKFIGDSLIISNLANGSYKLITMGTNDYFNSIYDFDQFATTGLKRGIDYAENDLAIKNGIITAVTVNEVPFFDETKFYFTGENTSFTVNKPTIVVGNYLTFRARIDFKDQFKDKVNDVQLIVDLPGSCSFYENSVMVGASLGGYSVIDNRVLIPIANYDELIRFCAIPTKAGDFAPSAFVVFNYNGKTVTQPIGSAAFFVEGLSSLIVPTVTATPKISIGGTAYSNCQIDIYDNDVLIGHTTSNANSKWLTECDLYQPHNLSVHNIYANITTDQGIEVPTQIVSCTYNNNSVRVAKVTQYNEQRGPTPYLVTWNFLNPSLSSQHYSYDMYDNHRTFSYTIEFTDNKAVSNVVLYVKTAKTGWWLLDATYDEEKDVWVTAGEFGDSQNADLPINVGVDFKCTIDSVNVENLVYAIANSINHIEDASSGIPELDNDDFTVTQDQGKTVFNFNGLQVDGAMVKSITIIDDEISMEYVIDGISKILTMSYDGVDLLPDNVYEYVLNDTQSVFVTDTIQADTLNTDTTYYISSVNYFYPVSIINSIVRSPYGRQSHAFDSFNGLLNKAGTKHYVNVLGSIKQNSYIPPTPPRPNPTLDDVLGNCPELEPMVEAMRWRQEHARRLNDALDRFQRPFEWLSTILGRLGPLGEAASGGLEAGNHAINAGQFIGNYLNGLHDNVYMAQFEAAGCIPPNRPPRPPHQYPGADQTFCIDPSGFVYEGVPSNRLKGVTATCYYKETVEDMYGDTHEEVVLWDATQYGQENPLLTDENGFYRWDVPIGMWQVKYEKEGYETTYSDWLPVPPPQLDVNIGMVQMRQPEVIKARAYPQAVELEFDKFMFPETLTTDNITVSVNGTAVPGSIELLNAEVDDPLAITSIRRAPGTGLTFASRVRFNANSPFNADKVTLHVKKDVKSYADLEMNEDYEAVLDVELEIQSIVADSTVNVLYGDSRELTVTVSPAAASKGKTLTVRSIAPMIATTDAETYTLNNNGQAVITVHGDLPGMTSLVYGIDGYDLSASTLVNVLMESQMTVATPTATIATGSTVEEGTAVYLRCATEGATIYYTLDGSCPCDPSPARKVYDGSPIIINGTVTIKAMATAPDLYDSDVATFVYRVGSGMKGDVNGDGEVNIADVNAVIDIIAGGAADADTRYRADVNGDGEVNIADINAVIDIILNPANNVGMKVNCDDLLHVDDVTMNPGDVRTLKVTLDRAARYSAVQCDLVLPAGLTLVDAHAVGANVMRMGSMDDFTNRVLSYSMSKLPFVSDSQPVMTITVRADAALAPESEITLTHVVLADVANKAWRTDDAVARVNNATGITDVTATAGRVWVEKRTLCIETGQGGIARIVGISGMVRDLDVNPGITRYEIDPGIYVVILGDRSYKIAVK